MANEKPSNLDSYCARYAQQIVGLVEEEKDVKDLENHLTKALGVLQEDGLYAFYLYLRYRKLDTGDKDVWGKIRGLLQEEAMGQPLRSSGDDDNDVVGLTEELGPLFLAKDLAERTLVYARYGLRAKVKE